MFGRNAFEMRVLILAPVGRDAPLLAKTLATLDVDTATALNAEMLLHMMQEGFGAAIVADEALPLGQIRRMGQWLVSQPPWSDPPLLILMPRGRPGDYSYHRAEEFSSLGNFTLIERPVRPETILSAVRAALRGRMRQYEIRSRHEALVRANADLEQFAHSASHDLQEPLRNISIFSELLATRCGQLLDESGTRFLQVIREGSKRMEHLLGDLISYAQASSIPDELPEPISVSKPLEVALANLGASIREANAQITIGEMPVVRVRESHLSQLFQNLVGNAIKYRREGVTPQICLTAKRLDDRWLFSIVDNGIGIAAEYRESIFGIFKRLHSNGQYAGTGMGLAICQRIVERYQGRIWVESEPGSGSTFLFTIPS